LARTGTHILLDGVTPNPPSELAINDWPLVDGNASFGIDFGLRNEGAAHASINNYSSDAVPQLSLAGGAYLTRAQNTIGIKIGNLSRNIVINSSRSAAKGRGIVVETTGEGARVAINSPRIWLPIVYSIHHVSGSMVLNDTGGLEPRTAGEIAAGYPNGNILRIEDGITKADITIRGDSAPAVSASSTALAKTTFNNGAPFTIASAASIAVEPYYKRANLTGTTNVGTISAVSPGQFLLLSSTSSRRPDLASATATQLPTVLSPGGGMSETGVR